MSDELRIPKDPVKRAALFRMAGLTEEEEAAVNEMCHLQAVENESRLRRGLEAHGDDRMAVGDTTP